MNPEVRPQDLQSMDLMDLYVAHIVKFVNDQNKIVAINRANKS